MENSTDRRRAFTQAAAGTDLPWSFFPAYREIASPLAYREADAVRRFGRPMAANEIGCYTSHYKCWEWLAQSDYKQVIIFEDDVLCDWAALKAIAAHDYSPYGINFLRLFATHPVKWKIVKFRLLSPHIHLIRTVDTTFGMQGYLLTKDGAQRLLSRYANILMPVDWVVSRYWEHGLLNYSVFPYPIIERHVPSTIGDERNRKIKISLSDRLFRFLWKRRDRIARKYTELMLARRPLGAIKDAGPPFLCGSD
jgi:glycosyl transferase family 25